MTWSCMFQTLVALSMMEAEYITLSMACHDLIPMMELTREMAEHYIESHKARPNIMCKFLKDNFGVIEMACTPKL